MIGNQGTTRYVFVHLLPLQELFDNLIKSKIKHISVERFEGRTLFECFTNARKLSNLNFIPTNIFFDDWSLWPQLQHKMSHLKLENI